MGTALTCLDENSALDFLSGRLGPNALSDAERHLGTCAPCVELLARSAPFFPIRSGGDGETPRPGSPSLSTLAMQPIKRSPFQPAFVPTPPAAGRGPSGGGGGHEDGDPDDVQGPPTLTPGTVLKDTYTVMELVGRGGMGEVYEVAHARLAGRYALKLLPPAFALEHVSVTRFRREADITSAMRHPNIIQVIDFDHTPAGQPFLVMELLDGGDLAQLMAAGPMPLSRVLGIVEQIVSALSAVHRKGIVHRDLKPQNVLLVRDEGFTQDRLKLVDFGLSKRSEAALLDIGSNISRDQTLLGTPRYMAPEQASGRIDEIDATTDQFALGAMVYEMLTGKSAFDGEHMAMLLYRIVSEEPIPMSRFVPDLPEHVEAAVRRAMAKQRADRFPTANDFLIALSGNSVAWTAERLNDSGRGILRPAGTRAPISSPGVGAPLPEPPSGSRRRWAAFGVGVVAAVGLAVGWRMTHQPPPPSVAAEPPATRTSVAITNEPAPSAPVPTSPTNPGPATTAAGDAARRPDSDGELPAKEQANSPAELSRHGSSRASKARGDGATLRTNGRKAVTAVSHPRKSGQPAAQGPSLPEEPTSAPVSKNNVGILVGDELIK
jgi:serine/threonine-protein kinase